MVSLWLPDSVKREDRTMVCRLCGDRLRPHETSGHIRDCYRRNEAEIREQSLREKAPGLFGDQNVDNEFYEWHRRRGTHLRRDV